MIQLTLRSDKGGYLFLERSDIVAIKNTWDSHHKSTGSVVTSSEGVSNRVRESEAAIHRIVEADIRASMRKKERRSVVKKLTPGTVVTNKSGLQYMLVQTSAYELKFVDILTGNRFQDLAFNTVEGVTSTEAAKHLQTSEVVVHDDVHYAVEHFNEKIRRNRDEKE